MVWFGSPPGSYLVHPLKWQHSAFCGSFILILDLSHQRERMRQTAMLVMRKFVVGLRQESASLILLRNMADDPGDISSSAGGETLEE